MRMDLCCSVLCVMCYVGVCCLHCVTVSPLESWRWSPRDPLASDHKCMHLLLSMGLGQVN